MMIQRITPVLILVALAGCSSRDADLERFIAQTKQEQPGGIDPLPGVKPYDSFKYDPAGMRSPFVPYAGAGGTPGVRPQANRNREFLEKYSLDQLKMAGTMTVKGKTYALVKTSDNLVQQVLPGNYLGQSEGRITKIEPSKISIIETVADGTGGYIERAGALTLNE